MPERPYVYQHYPLWITGADGVRKIVHNAEEEARETASPSPPETIEAPKRRGRPPKVREE